MGAAISNLVGIICPLVVIGLTSKGGVHGPTGPQGSDRPVAIAVNVCQLVGD
jgi:hypothetical protein